MNELNCLHHITLCTGDAQEDYDFHTGTLGLRSVKKTLLYDGKVPIYHFYYANANGAPSSIVTTFPMRHTGRVGRRGANQIKTLMLAVPYGACDYWHARLAAHGIAAREFERLGERRLAFAHPCGIPYELVEVANDTRPGWDHGGVPREAAIHGMHGIEVSVRDRDVMDDFVREAWSCSRAGDDGATVRFAMGSGRSGTLVDITAEPDRHQGTWTFGEGTVHHCAFDIASLDLQREYKAYVEGLGYTDVSDVKDRGYFDSVYVRTPGGALFEATVSKAAGWAVDEDPAHIGEEIMVSPQFAEERERILDVIGRIAY
ncbi:MAG: VOC family protein [Gammaproteobacteria bacterium]